MREPDVSSCGVRRRPGLRLSGPAPVALLVLWAACAGATQIRVGWSEIARTIRASGDTIILLPPVILVRDSVRVEAGPLPLIPDHDYRVDYAAREVRLARAWPVGTRIVVRYRSLPTTLPIRRQWMAPSDTAVADPVSAGRPVPAGGLPSIARVQPVLEPAGDLRIGGTKTFAIQVGSDRDLALEQSLRVSVNGRVGRDVDVTAELSDQNLPIQPEGTTEDIREIDKVLVQVASPHYQAVLGSYDIAWSRGEFGRYARRLDGAQVQTRHDQWSVMAGVATARGRYRTYQLPVIDGNQGPYRLTDEAGMTGIVVIAGTERVWIDGELLRRGDNNDYTMDYAAGEITFARKRLVTGDMRVIADYEYTAEDYGRTSVLMGADFATAGKGWQVAVLFAQEGDNASEPLALSIDDTARSAIAAAGDDPLAAARPGWTARAGGAYRAVSVDSAHFAYVGDAAYGDYDVSFTHVGSGKGSYTREQGFFSAVYTWRGPGQGDWVPYILYPLPERRRLATFCTGVRPFSRATLDGEVALSDVDRNTLSTIGDGNNRALAGRASFVLDATPLDMGGRDLGTVGLSAVVRAVEPGFSPMTRTTEAEDSRRWGLPVDAGRDQERTGTFAARYVPRPGHELALDVGAFDRDTTADGPAYRAYRSGAGWRTRATGWPALQAYAEVIRSRASRPGEDAVNDQITRGAASATYAVGHLVPGARFEGELDVASAGGRRVRGTRYDEYGAQIATAGIGAFAASAGVERRVDQAFDTTLASWADQQRALTQTWRAAVRQWHGFSLAGEYAWRRREGPAVGPATVSDVADVDAELDTRNGLLRNRVRYRVAATRTARRERIYVRAEQGHGDFAPRDPDDDRQYLAEDEVIEVPPGDPRASYVLRYRDTDEFQPTVSLDASWQIGLDLGRVWRGAPDPRSNRLRPIWQRLLRIISTETALQVSEAESLRTADLYLVKFWTFRRPGRSPTVRGSLSFLQDVMLWQHARRGDLRLRTRTSEDYDASLLQQTGTPAVTRQEELAARGRLRFAGLRADWMGELSYQRDHRSGGQFDYRARRMLLDQTWAWHPTLQVEWALRNEAGVGSDPTPDAGTAADLSRPLRAYLVGFEPSFRRAWGNRGMVRLSAQWFGVSGRNLLPGASLPIRLLDGRNVGSNFRWAALLTYRLSALVTASLTYDGRKVPRQDAVHTGRMEVRATF